MTPPRPRLTGRAGERIFTFRAHVNYRRLLDGFELIEPEILARYAQPHELGGAASESPVGWRVLARKP